MNKRKKKLRVFPEWTIATQSAKRWLRVHTGNKCYLPQPPNLCSPYSFIPHSSLFASCPLLACEPLLSLLHGGFDHKLWRERSLHHKPETLGSNIRLWRRSNSQPLWASFSLLNCKMVIIILNYRILGEINYKEVLSKKHILHRENILGGRWSDRECLQR